MDAESQAIEDLKEALHEAGARNGRLVLQLREKDAKIARLKQWNLMTDEQVVMDLKAEIERLNKLYRAALEELVSQGQLITECADALAEQDPGYDRYKTLIQRIREASKCVD